MSSSDRPFKKPGNFFAGLDVDTAAALITASADIVLVLDEAGLIQDLALASDDLVELGARQWMSKPWIDTVTVESRPKIQALLTQRPAGDGVRWRHVNHVYDGGMELPVSYCVVPCKGTGVRPCGMLAFGRDLRPQVALQQRLVTAQQSMERDYWRLRQIETRYRLLFQMASEATLILAGSMDKVEEANPAALELFGEAAQRPGWSLADSLEPSSAESLRQMLETLRHSGSAQTVALQVKGLEASLSASATQFRQNNALYFLLKISQPQGQAAVQAAAGNPAAGALVQMLEQAPDAIVTTELSGHILTVNPAFVELAELGSQEQAVGQSLEKWLGRTGVEFKVLVSNLRQHGTVRLFATQLVGEHGSISEVEISAVAIGEGEQRRLGFAIRDIGRRLSGEGRSAKGLPRSASQMTELVGRMPLKDIVRETTDLIEQLCIEAALQLTGGNRASAAEMLGLSRQSLYIKLRRFGIGDASEEAENDSAASQEQQQGPR